MYTVSRKKVGHDYYFLDIVGKSGPIFVIFFTVKFRKDLPSNSVTALYLTKSKRPNYLTALFYSQGFIQAPFGGETSPPNLATSPQEFLASSDFLDNCLYNFRRDSLIVLHTYIKNFIKMMTNRTTVTQYNTC